MRERRRDEERRGIERSDVLVFIISPDALLAEVCVSISKCCVLISLFTAVFFAHLLRRIASLSCVTPSNVASASCLVCFCVFLCGFVFIVCLLRV